MCVFDTDACVCVYTRVCVCVCACVRLSLESYIRPLGGEGFWPVPSDILYMSDMLNQCKV